MSRVRVRHSRDAAHAAGLRKANYITNSYSSITYSYLTPGRVTRTGRGVARIRAALWKVREEVAIAVTIGASAALIIIGAILRFGVTWQPAHVDLQVIGVILMVAGVLGLALSLLFMVMRRNDRRSAQVYEERRYNEPPM